MEKFLIISTPRSGSTVLVRSLDEHPEIFCAGEIFNTSNDIHHSEYHFPSWGFDSTNHSILTLNRFINYPNHRFRSIPHVKKFYNSNTKGEKTRGFKLMLSNIKSAPYLWQYIKNENVKAIVLIRKNVFKTIISRHRKNANRIPHITEGKAPSIFFKLPVANLIDQIKILEAANENLLQCSEQMNRIILHYEDLFNWDETMNSIQKFLSVNIIALPAVLKKISAQRWQDEIENYTEVEKLMRQNGFEKYLD